MKILKKLLNKKIKKAKTYSSLDIMPIYNFYQCLDKKYNFMLVGEFDDVNNKEPSLQLEGDFLNLVFDLKRMNVSSIRKNAEVTYLTSLSLIENKEIYKIRAEMIKDSIKEIHEKRNDLNEICVFIESTLKINAIDVFKISVNRFFEYSERATKIIKNAAN